MSLLDRVNRNLGPSMAPAAPPPPPPPAPPAAPAAYAPAPSNGSAHAAPAFAPRITQVPVSPGNGSGPATSDNGAPAPRPSGGSPLMARSGLQRTSGAKSSALHQQYVELRSRVHQRLVEQLVDATDNTNDSVVAKLAELVGDVAAELNLSLTRQDRQRLVEALTNDVLGLGPLESLLKDPEVTEIMINGPTHIYVEQGGRLTRSPISFESTDQLMQVIDRIVSSIGRRVDESSPMVDARLKDGSRVNVIIPPLALRGPTVTIRKFAKEALEVEDLVRFGSITEDMIRFLEACVRGRLNVVVSGGTGSGKTTTLNILSSFIPGDERIVTIEDAAELQLRQEHVVTLETRPANVEGRGRITIRDLVINALRMRPDRIVIGECRGGEALDMLQAMNTGHDGSLTTLHANNARDCISRLETMVLMAGAELPSRAIREQIGSAVNVIVQQSRLRDGARKIVGITEVLGTDDNNDVKLQELFAYRQTGIDAEGRVIGAFMPTGNIPTFLEYLRSSGERVPETIFQPVHVVEATS
jgi:pilus assembly protein CpaF